MNKTLQLTINNQYQTNYPLFVQLRLIHENSIPFNLPIFSQVSNLKIKLTKYNW